jgi:hypothetical protein
MPKSLTPRLAQLKDEIEGYARGFGLDFFETVFELLGYDELNMVASYGGFPNRYPHWRWGMEYEQLSKGYEYGLSKIYELVINNDPCYAYLLESNAEGGPEAGDGPRLRPLRLLQEQLLLPAHQPPDDGRDGEPRHPRPEVGGQGGHREGRGLHRPGAEPREPHRLPLAVHPPLPGPEAGPSTRRRATSGSRASGWTASTCAAT